MRYVRDVIVNSFTKSDGSLIFVIKGVFGDVCVLFDRDTKLWFVDNSLLGYPMDRTVVGITVYMNKDITEMISQLRKIHTSLINYWSGDDEECRQH